MPALSSDVISNTMAGILQEFLKTNERSVFWDEALKVNVDPLHELPGGFWGAGWDLRVCDTLDELPRNLLIRACPS